MANVVLADSHSIYRLGLKTYLKSTTYNVIGEAGSFAELHDVLEEKPCDVLFYDCYLPYGELLDSLLRLKALQPNMKIILVTYTQFFHINQERIRKIIDGVCLRTCEFNDVLKTLSSFDKSHDAMIA
ncbi:response regulator [Saccharobesus litoralis]|nr:response regulator [Saccharobesus litoralis]